jgi:hypothetical protein
MSYIRELKETQDQRAKETTHTVEILQWLSQLGSSI